MALAMRHCLHGMWTPGVGKVGRPCTQSAALAHRLCSMAQEMEMVNASAKYKVFSAINGEGGLEGGFGGEDPRLFTPCGGDGPWVSM